MPLRDDGLYRGDGAFEVIRLYEGRPFALGDHLDRLQRSAAAIELEFDRGGAGARDRRAARRGGRRRRAAAPDRHPGRAADRRHRAAAAPRRDVATRHRHLLPDRDPQRGQVALLCRQHAGDRLAKAAGRRRGGAGPARRHGAGAADLLDLLGIAAGRAAHPALDAGVLESITRDRLVKALQVEEGAWPVADLRAAERGLPRLDHAGDPGGRRDRRDRALPRRRGLAPARRRRPSRRP